MTNLDLSMVIFSRKDKEKGIILPEYLTEELAEDIGIHIGDGSMYFKKGKIGADAITISSNNNEMDYLNYVIELKKKLYNLNKYRILYRNNERNLKFHSLAISTFYNSVFGLPIGSKDEVDIPHIIMQSKDNEILSSVIRGLTDTDFGLIKRIKYGKIYPTLEGSSKSKKLIDSLSILFKKLGIKHYTCKEQIFDKRTKKIYTRNKIIINGFKRISFCFDIILPKNPKYIRKIKEMGPKRFEFEKFNLSLDHQLS